MPVEMIKATCKGLTAAGFHRISYCQWGETDNPDVVFCVHGLTRNARDFDDVARALASNYRVICPDVVGRGESDWLADKNAYQMPQYLADMTVLIARSGAEKVDWIGTSMGGLIGMMLAAQPGSPVSRLVVNDVGPYLPLAGVRRIAEYVGQNMTFADLDAMEQHLRTVCAGFGPLTDSQWRHLTRHGARRTEGDFALSYDPDIRLAFANIETDVDLWSVWARIQQDVLILRGADSDILSRETAKRMMDRDASTQLVEFEAVGHSPMLMDDDQIGTVMTWLTK